jgi:phytoene synthase
MYKGTPTHPVTQALQPHLRSTACKNSTCRRSSTAWRWTSTRAATSITRACASTAGMWRAWSASCRPASSATTNPQTLAYAEKLGLAFQLTNIIRDVGEDARKGRIYLPVNELQQFGVTAADLLNARHSDKFEALMRFQTERAQTDVRRGASPCCRRKTGAPSVPA